MNVTSDIKYQFSKTKICKHFLEQKCLNTHNCNYAHVLGELRPLPNLMNTKLCRSYKKNIPCINPNCKYAHKVENLQPTTDLSTYKTSLCYFWKRKKCMNEEKCRFAHGIEEIRPLKVRTQKEIHIKEEKINDHNNHSNCNINCNINCNSNMDELQNDNKKNIFNQEDLNNLLSHLLLIQNWSPEIKNNDKNEQQQIYTNENIVSNTSLSSNMLIQNSKEHNKEYINLSIYNKLCDENLNANYNKQLDDYIKYNSLKINDNNSIERSTTNTIQQDQYGNLFSSNDTFCDSNEDNYNDTHVPKDQDFYKHEYMNIYNYMNDPIFTHISSEQPMNDEDCFDELYKSIKEEITKKYENIYIY